MKIPWEWTWEKYVEKSRKVEIKMQSASNFSLWGKNGKWDTVSGVGTNVGEKLVGKISKISGFVRKMLFQKWVGNVGAGLVRPVRTCWDRFGPIFMGKCI